MLQSIADKAPDSAPATPSKGVASALSAVQGVFSNPKVKEQITKLTEENNELKKLERLRPQLMELQQRITVLQREAEENDAKRSEAIETLSDENKELAEALRQSQQSLEAVAADRENSLRIANEWSNKAARAEREITKMSGEIEELKERISEMTMQAVDPLVVDGLQDKIVELESE